MRWVIRKQIRVDRAAAACLIRRFMDRGAEFLFVHPDKVAQAQRA
jgi:hypothetical protein